MKIHRGITRTVFVGKRWAVKFPSLRPYDHGIRGVIWSFTRGVQANLSEIEWSEMEGVCPVRWSLWGLVNVYPTAQPVPDDVEIDYTAILGHPISVDKKPPNVGILNGRMVWVDYDMSWNDCITCHRLPLTDDE